MSAVARWRLERRIKRESMRISSEIFPTLWENVRRKITSDNKNELTAYIKTRAAQLSQERVEGLATPRPTSAIAVGSIEDADPSSLPFQHAAFNLGFAEPGH